MIDLFSGESPLKLESGVELGPVRVAYETYGQLNEDASNAIYICHALTGDAHVAGKHSPESKKAGWWDGMVGPGKTFDTNRFFVICSNVLGGCQGTTGPCSTNPATGKPWGSTFPFITIGDMVEVHAQLVRSLGIQKLLAVVGGSLGGMMALDGPLDFQIWRMRSLAWQHRRDSRHKGLPSMLWQTCDLRRSQLQKW